MSPQIRILERGDLDAVGEMVRAEGWTISVPSIMDFKDLHPCGALVAVDHRGNVIGFITTTRVGDKDLTILYIIVTKSAQGRGVGSLLLRYVENYARNMTVSLLAFPGAETFYEKFNYRSFNSMTMVVNFLLLDSNKLNNAKPVESIDANVVYSNAVSFHKLVAYDTDVVGYSRETYLQNVLFKETHSVMVALDRRSGDVIGYCGAGMIGKTLCVAPLYANSNRVAYALFKEAITTTQNQYTFQNVKVHCPQRQFFLRSLGTVVKEVVLRQMANGDLDTNLSSKVYSYITSSFP